MREHRRSSGSIPLLFFGYSIPMPPRFNHRTPKRPRYRERRMRRRTFKTLRRFVRARWCTFRAARKAVLASPPTVRAVVAALQGREYAALLLDDAHGFGVLGEHGRGLLDELELWPHVNGGPAVNGVQLFVGGTLAKALGGFGGIIPGTREFVERARRSSHYFDGASAPASAEAGATAKALEIVLREPALRQRLRANLRQVRTGLRELSMAVPEGEAANFGVSVGGAENMRRISEALKARGILLPYVGTYSGIPPAGVLRFAIFATHTGEQLDRLLAGLRAVV